MKKVILVIFSLLFLVGCNQNSVQHNTKLEESFHSVVKEENTNKIDINSLTDFTWDQAFLFPPYTVQESINEQLGVRFKDPSNMDMRDDIYLLVFLNEEKVVQYAEINRQQADFTIGEQKYLTPANTTIKIKRY